MDLGGKVALISGAAGGMGTATSQRLAALGATVVGVDVADDVGARVFAELGSPHRYRHLDVTDPQAWEAIAREVIDELGRLDIVHLNAGVMLRPQGVDGLDDVLPWLTADRYRRVMSVNADGTAFGLMATLPCVKAGGGGDIVITASIAGITPTPFDPVYAMSKHALVGFVVSLAPVLEAEGVRLNAICPGGVDTAMVPPDMKAAAPALMSPPSFIADVVVEVLESARGGGIWVAMSHEPRAVWLHQFAPLAPAQPV